MAPHPPVFWLAAVAAGVGALVLALLNRRQVEVLVDQLADEVRPALIGRPTSPEPLHTARAVAPRVG